MMNWFLLISVSSISISIIYAALILFYKWKWNALREFESTDKIPSTKVSVVIAARNESATIHSLLKSLQQQNFPSSHLEIILVDDCSEDNTVSIINNFKSNSALNIKVIELGKSNSTLSGKKAAITEGVKSSIGDLIITTDADSTAGKNWLRTIVLFYETHHPKMISAPVLITGESAFEQMQSLEQISLIGTTASSMAGGFALMCNGANLAYEKKVFEELNGFENNNSTATGDDTFLMFKIDEAYPGSVMFLKSKDAIVYTKAQSTLKDFMQQRTRWASKISKYKNLYVPLTGALVVGINFCFLFLLAAGIINMNYFVPLIIIFGIKLIVDIMFLLEVSNFFSEKKLLKWFLFVEILYAFYILATAISSQVGGFSWKGRKLK